MATITNAQNTASRRGRVGRLALRWLGRGLAWVAGALVVLALVGASYEAIAASGDARRYPMPGQLVDVGGYRLPERNLTAIPSWAKAQRRQAALSTHGHLIIPPGSVHYLRWEQPTIVIDAVQQVVADVRGR